MEKYNQLRTAVEDLLCELRISPVMLKIMAEGYSPDYTGVGKAINDPFINFDHVKDNFFCKVQISKVVANKLIEAGVIDEYF